MNDLLSRIRDLDAVLSDAGIAHAFGGALALAYHVREPRATRDIDLNVFLSPERFDDVIALLPPAIETSDRDRDEVLATGQVRVFWEQTPVDLFFSNHRFHDEAERHVVVVPLGDGEIPILGATELAVFKAFFNRTKDWADIEEMVRAHAVDTTRALGWMVELMGPHDERTIRMAAIVKTLPPDQDPTFAPLPTT